MSQSPRRHRTTSEGIHLAAMAGSVDLVQRCFTGPETRADRIMLSPDWPESLDTLAFPIRYRDHRPHLRDRRHECGHQRRSTQTSRRSKSNVCGRAQRLLPAYTVRFPRPTAQMKTRYKPPVGLLPVRVTFGPGSVRAAVGGWHLWRCVRPYTRPPECSTDKGATRCDRSRRAPEGGREGRYRTPNWGREEPTAPGTLAALESLRPLGSNRHKPSAPIASCAACRSGPAVSGNDTGRSRPRMTCGSGATRGQIMSKSGYVRFFEEIGIEDVPLVGGKNASLGEMFQKLSEPGRPHPARVRHHRRGLSPHVGQGRRLGPSARRARRHRPRRRRRAGAQRPSAPGRSSTAPGSPTTWPPRFWLPTASFSRSTARMSASPSGARRPPRTCRRRASPASRIRISTSRATRVCSTRAAVASPACSPIARSTTASTRASTTSRSRCRSA